MRPPRPATAQSRLGDIKAEWQAASQSVLSSGAHSRAQTPDLGASRPGSRSQHRAQVAQARSRLKALEAELHHINRAGARPGSRADSPTDGPRQPASIQDEMRATFVRKDDLVASHAQAPSYRPAALPNAVAERDEGANRRGILSPITGAHRRRNSASSLPRQDSVSSLRQRSASSSRATSPRESAWLRPASGHMSAGSNGRRGSFRQPSFRQPRPRSGSFSSVQFAEVGNGGTGEGGWIAYDDIREIINEETKKVLSLHAVNKMHREKQKGAGWVVPETDAPHESLAQPIRQNAALQKHGDPKAPGSPVQGALNSEQPPTAKSTSPKKLSSPAGLPGNDAQHGWDDEGRGHGGEIPHFFSDGRVNPYYLLKDEQARTMTILGFFGFSRHSLIRSKMILILNDGHWQAIFVSGAILNSIYIAALPSFDPTVLAENQAAFEMADAVFLAIFYFEMIAGWIAWGFGGKDTAWFNRDFFNRLDFFIFLVSIYEQMTRLLNVQSFTLRPLRLLRIIKVMTSLERFASVKAILITLGEGIGQLLVVFGIFVCFLGIFAVFGMGAFRQSFSRRCAMLPVPVPACASDNSTGWHGACDFRSTDEYVAAMGGTEVIAPGYPWVLPCKIYFPTKPGEYDGIYPKTPDGNYHSCQLLEFRRGLPINQVCVDQGNPQRGYQHFDDISGALLAVLQVALPDSSYDILHIGLQSERTAQPVTYVFILCISIFLTFLVLGLFVAVVTGTFARVRERQAAERRARETRHKKQLEAEWEAWDAWRAEVGSQGEDSEAASHAGSRPSSKYGRPGSARPASGRPGSARPHRPSGPRPRSALTLGLKWQIIGQDPPRSCTELRHQKLEELMQTKLKESPGQDDLIEMTRDELSQMTVFVISTSCIKVSGWYLVPITQSEASGFDGKEGADDGDDEEEGGEGDQGFARLDLMARARLEDLRLKRAIWATVVLHLVGIAGLTNEVTPAVWFDLLDILCNLVFFSEACLRYVALNGFQGVVFDLTARNEVGLLCLTLYGHTTNETFLKLLPVLRIYRLMVFLPTLEDLLGSAVASSASLINLIIFIFICALCAGVTGRYLIGTDMDSLTRSSFGTFLGAMLTVFQLLFGDSYTNIVYSSLWSQDSAYGQFFACIFVLIWFFTAQLLIANLFVAVIIENFQVSRTILKTQQPGYWAALRGYAHSSWDTFKHLGFVRREGLSLDKDGNIKVIQHLSLDVNYDELVASTQYNAQIQKLVSDVLPSKAVLNAHKRKDEPERVLYCLQPRNPIRRLFIYISQQPLFDTIVFGAIGCSCVFLVVTPPYEKLPKGPTDPTVIEPPIPLALMELLSLVFTLVFSIEFISRVMAVGLWQTRHAYLKSGWNVMDTGVLVFAIVDELQLFPGGNVAKVMRLARALRPLRLMKRNAGMKLLIDALIGTLYPVVYVLLFACITALAFALVGQGLYRNLLDRCSTPGAEYPAGRIECSGYHVQENGILVQRAWVKPYATFDTLPSALLTLFQLSTLKYISVMQDVMDITAKDSSPQMRYSEGNSMFVMVYLIFGSLFIMNLFVGFIVDGFNSNKGDDSEAETEYGRLLRATREFSPSYDRYLTPQNKFARAVRLVIDSSVFVGLSMSCVFISICFMLADHRDPAPEFAQVYELQNTALFWVLVGETTLVAMGYGPQGWLNDGWKAFDLFVCVGSAAGVISSRPDIQTVSRCFRIFRIVRLMKMFRPIRIILNTLIASLPQLVNIAALLFMFWSMFAVVFVQLYSTTKFGIRLGPTANFRSYFESLITVYQMVTGDEWMLIMKDCYVVWPECTPIFSQNHPRYYYQGPEYEFGDCGNLWAPGMFVIFMLFCQSVMLNLFIGMILDNFSFITDDGQSPNLDEDPNTPNIQHIRQLSIVFKRYDYTHSGMVALSNLHRILLDSPKPLGFGGVYGPAEDAAQKMIRAELNTRITERVRKSKNQMWINKLTGMLVRTLLGGLAENENLFKSMSFEDYTCTLISWRSPECIPKALRIARVKGLPEILAMTQALIMRDFLWDIGPSKRRKQEVTRVIRQRRTFFRWTKHDQPYCRYRLLKIEMNEEREAKALRNVVYRNIDYSPPANTSYALITPLEHVPKDFIKIPEAVIQYLRHPVIKPSHGIESFLGMIHGGTSKIKRQHYVLCRFVDDRTVKHKNWGELVYLADFTNVEYNMWNEHDKDSDVLFLPQTKRDRVDAEHPNWRRIDIKFNKFRVNTIKRKLATMSKDQLALHRRAALLGATADVDYESEFRVFNPRELVGIGTLLAVHAYSVESDSFARTPSQGEYAIDVRLILGTHPLDPPDMRLKALRDQGLQKCEDAVLQVLGFLPKGPVTKEDQEQDEEEEPDPGQEFQSMAADVQSETNEESGHVSGSDSPVGGRDGQA